MPRTKTPAGKFMTFLYGTGLLGSMIQTEPTPAPVRDVAANRLLSGDQTIDPFAICGEPGLSSGLEATRCPSGLISCAKAPMAPPLGSMNAITSSRDHEGPVAAAGVGSRVVLPAATVMIIRPGASPIGVEYTSRRPSGDQLIVSTTSAAA